jgi:eukaryotic-like serine/threonine-protein kinase
MSHGSDPRAVPQSGGGRTSAQDDKETRTANVPGSAEGAGAEDGSLRDGERDPITPGQRIGRYTVLGLIGVGGMGQVCSAYDPKLDRRVALKLLHTQGSAVERDRLRREARALARLSHPNVVTVHEVDEHDGRLLVAMEQVDGDTLKGWSQGAPRDGADRLRAALDLLLQAGRGLAAAHASGLVHRDFKPANVLVGRDGRVRVVDFGLARAMPASGDPAMLESSQDIDEMLSSQRSGPEDALTKTGMVAGTPAYMAPEQFGGKQADGQSDQFSFCVAAWEVLFGERPFAGGDQGIVLAAIRGGRLRRPESVDVPPVVEAALRKGLSLRPKNRHASMEVLLAQLEAATAVLAGNRAPKRASTGWKIAGGTLVILGVGIGAQRLHVARSENACRAEGDAIDGVWNASSRAAVRDGLSATGLGYAPTVAEKVVPWLDAQAEVWRLSATDACMNATVRGKWDAVQLDKAQWCLEQRRLELSALVGELAEADRDVVQNAVEAASTLARVDECVLEGSVATMVDPPSAELRPQAAEVLAQLSRAETLKRLGRYPAGLAVAQAARGDAEGLGWPPLTAAARFAEADLLGSAGDYANAEAVGVAAFMEAVRSGAWDVAADAAIEMAYVVGHRRGRPDEGRLWAEHAAATLSRGTDPAGLREAARLTNLGAISTDVAAYGEAKEFVLRSLQLRESALGPEHPNVADTLGNLAGVHEHMGEYRDTRNLAERQLAIAVGALGVDHPGVAGALMGLGRAHAKIGAFEEARECMERALTIYEKALGTDHPTTLNSLTNLGALYDMLGEHQAARIALERALSINEKTRGADHSDSAGLLLNLGGVHKSTGAYEEAKRYDERALAIWEKTQPPDHPYIAMALGNLGGVQLLLGEYQGAKLAFQRALAITENSLGKDHPDVAFALNGLGEALHALGDHRAAIDHLTRAVSIRSAEGVAPNLLAHSRFALAKALWDAPRPEGRDRPRAHTLANQARDQFATGGEDSARDLANVETWLRAHPL